MAPFEIPWAAPAIDDAEWRQVKESFDADWLTMGPKVAEFERRMAERFGVRHAVAVSNGTVALDLALRTLGIKPEDEVIVPAMTYIATASAVCFSHAVPVFVDIESLTWNLDPARIAEAITDRTKAVIFIDYGGSPADYAAIAEVASQRGVAVLQDGAQSLGAQWEGRPAGAQAAYATMSFHLAKVMTTVEGGMVFSSDDEFIAEVRARRNQGERPGDKYRHSYVGMNARMTDMQAGIGLAQLDKLDGLLERRRAVARMYDERLAPHSKIRRASIRPGCVGAYFFYPVLIEGRDSVAQLLRERFGIDTRIAYPMPVYQQPVFTEGRAACRQQACPVAEHVTARILNLPMFPQMTAAQVDKVTAALVELVE